MQQNEYKCENKKKHIWYKPKEFEGGIRSLFDPCVNAMGRRPYWPSRPSRLQVSYCTFGFGATFGAICAHYHYRVIHCAITIMRTWSTRERQLTLAWRAYSYEKIWRYNNSPPYVTVRWPLQQIPPLNFLVGYKPILFNWITKLPKTNSCVNHIMDFFLYEVWSVNIHFWWSLPPPPHI